MPAGEFLFREGEAGTHLYIIVKGQISLQFQTSRANKNEIEVARSGPPDAIGVLAVCQPYHHSFSAKALQNLSYIRIDGQSLRDKLDSYHQIGNAVRKNAIEALAMRLGQTREVLGFERAARL